MSTGEGGGGQGVESVSQGTALLTGLGLPPSSKYSGLPSPACLPHPVKGPGCPQGFGVLYFGSYTQPGKEQHCVAGGKQWNSCHLSSGEHIPLHSVQAR